jgi:ribosomal protein S18 acetylase RimI-like enzyme
MRVRRMIKRDFNAIIRIGRKLRITDDGKKGWFTKDAVEKHIPFDIRLQRGYVAEWNGGVVGFVTYTSYGYSPAIGWIAVDPRNHRRGIGAMLVKKVEAEMRRMGGKELFVETPTKEAGIGTEYEKTYKFYEGIGFNVDSIKKRGDPDSTCDCDMALMKKVLE